MARKTRTQFDTSEAMEEFKFLTEVRYEIAKEAYDYQDAETKKVIDRVCQRLALGANGYIQLRANPPHGGTVVVKIERSLLDSNILYVAMEIFKDLAMFDVRVANYQFPPTMCANCGAEIEVKKKVKSRG